MSTNTTPSNFSVLWRDTQAGRAEAWIIDGIRQRREMRMEWTVGKREEKKGN